MNCNNCNKEIKEEDNFCIYCGTPIKDYENISKYKSRKKLKIIFPILMGILIVISIVLIIIAKVNTNKRTEDTNTINEETTTQNSTANETSNNTSEETTSENLLDEIYAKYPELKNKEGIIGTDGTDYWLLDEEGKKVYFKDLESFEKAKEQCNLNEKLEENKEEIETNDKIANSNKETKEPTAPQENSSETGSASSTGSQNNQYIPQDDNNNNSYVDEMPNQWNAKVEIVSSDAYFNYNGQKCYVENFGNDIANANYFCYLQDPSSLSNYDLDKLMSKGKGVKYYINGKNIGDSTSRTFNYTFNKNQNITVKIVAPYIFDFATRKTVATNVTVYEKTDTAENFYKNRHDKTVSIPLPSIWS